MSLQKEFNAIAVIGAREIARFFKDWKTSLAFSLMMPVLFLGILGGSIAQNLSSGLGYNYLQFALIGMVANTLVMNTMMSVTSLVEDRENDFTQEIFVAPISRYSIILGKIVGGTITSILQLFAFVIVALVMGIAVGLSTIAWILLLAPIICVAGGSLGALIASIFSSSPKTADKGVIMIAFAQMFLSGAIIPIKDSTGVLGVLAHAMPMTYNSRFAQRTSISRNTSLQPHSSIQPHSRLSNNHNLFDSVLCSWNFPFRSKRKKPVETPIIKTRRGFFWANPRNFLCQVLRDSMIPLHLSAYWQYS